jgi:RND family efflux transporter MFP subunit
MNKSPSIANRGKTIIAPAIMLLAAAALFVLSSCGKEQGESKPPDVDYYTCTMHPSVKSQDPKGKCPICGMDLVPVKKNSGSELGPARTNSMNDMPGMDDHAAAQAGEQPGQFNVAIVRQQQIGVTYAVVEERPFWHTVRVEGVVAPDKERLWDYVARVGGYVQKLFVFSPGELVEKDAPLLTIYSPELLAAQKEFVDTLKMRDNASTNGNPDVLANAEHLLDSGRQRLRLWNIGDDQIAELEKTRQPREFLTLCSPFKGVVQDVGAQQGRSVNGGDQLVDIADLSVVWVWAEFYQDELPMLKKGLSVAVTSSSYPGEKFKGTISVIDPFINETLRTGRVRIDLENPGFKLRPGMYVDAELSMSMGEGLAVPVGAVLPTGLHNIAFVDRGEGRLEPRFLELGRKYGDSYEIISGLKENERVVASANFLIDAEAKVQGALKDW